jgi:hypothetical protein
LEHQSKTDGLKGKRKMDNVSFSTKRRWAVPAFKLIYFPDSTRIDAANLPAHTRRHASWVPPPYVCASLHRDESDFSGTS